MRGVSRSRGARRGRFGRSLLRGGQRDAAARGRRTRPLEPRGRRPGTQASRVGCTSSSSPGACAWSSGAARSPSPSSTSGQLVAYGGEQGLLGLAFSPGYARDRTLYVNYTARGDGSTRVVRYRVAKGSVVASSAQEHPPRRAAVPEPQRRQPRVRARREALGRPRRRRRGRRPREPGAEPRHAAREDVPAGRAPGTPVARARRDRASQPVAVQLRPRDR